MKKEIAEFWSNQLNNEIYLRNHAQVVRGSREYFNLIIKEREKYIYYLPKIMEHLAGGNLLEVGCGMGVDALLFARRGFNITGLDLAKEHIFLANKLFNTYNRDANFQIADAEDLPFANCSFPRVYSMGTLHHTPNIQKAIDEIHRVLGSNGRAVIMLYNKWSLNNFVHWISGRGFENARGDVDAPVTHRFSKRDIRKMCARFSKCKIEKEYLCGAGWNKVYDFIPVPIYRILSKLMGWHLVVYLEK